MYYVCYFGIKNLEEGENMIFSNVDQGLLLFYIAASLLLIAGILLFVSFKK